MARAREEKRRWRAYVVNCGVSSPWYKRRACAVQHARIFANHYKSDVEVYCCDTALDVTVYHQPAESAS